MEVNIPLRGSRTFDCVVCGGGLSGIAAAIAASRAGLKTALIEGAGTFGGVAVISGVNHLLGGRYYQESTGVMEKTVGGIFDELAGIMIAEGTAIDPETIDPHNNPHGWYPRMAAGIPFDGNAMKRILDAFIISEGVVPMLDTRIIGVQSAGDRIENVIVNNKSGNIIVKADCFIDATGDADIAAMAGARFDQGRETDHLTTPVSLEFHVDQVDRDELLNYQNMHSSPKLVEIIERLKEEGIWDFPFEIFVTVQLNDPDVFLVNTLRDIKVDGTDGDAVTTALIKGRADVFKLHAIMKQYFPGFARSRIRFIADHLGVRETRRIRGTAHVTLEDAKDGRRYEDGIARTTYNFDLPDPERPSYDPMMGDAKHPDASRSHTSIEVPYGVIVPQDFRNLLVTGRAVSVDREVLGPLRVMGPCMMLGEAAGTAAGLAVQDGLDCRDIDGKKLHERLIANGVLL